MREIKIKLYQRGFPYGPAATASRQQASMNPSPDDPSANDLTEQAVAWFVHWRSDEAGADDQRRFAAWLADSPAHAQAYAQVQRLFADMCGAAQAPGVRQTPPLSPAVQAPAFSRRRLWRRLRLAAWAVCGLLALGGLWRQTLADWWLADYRTLVGEWREMALADGSRLLLDTDSAVTLDYTDNWRRVRLLHGRARFQVAKDGLRPFEVAAGGLDVRALGTVFQVSCREDGDVEVAVQEHAVRVSQGPRRVEVAEGQGVRYRRPAGLGMPAAVDWKSAAAWQQHRLVFDDRPLAEAVAELDRYHAGRILLLDGELRRQRVTGVFDLDDPGQVLASIGKALGLRVDSLGPWWVWLHR